MLSTARLVIYEQPVSEHSRICLRLEFLFSKFWHCLDGDTLWDSSEALTTLLEILNVLDRPDLKAKLLKELGRYSTLLARFEEARGIDEAKLSLLLRELEEVLSSLYAVRGRITQSLRDNEFLNNIRHCLLAPSKTGAFDLSAYHFWLHQPLEDRKAQLIAWLSEIKYIETAVALALQLIRQSGVTDIQLAKEGFYQSALDSRLLYQLVRVAVPRTVGVYPVISATRYGLSLRFLALDQLRQKSMHLKESTEFELTLCIL